MPHLVKINVFDDGNEHYYDYPNKWIVLGSKFNSSKLILQNLFYVQFVINSISTWKTSQIYYDDS